MQIYKSPIEITNNSIIESQLTNCTKPQVLQIEITTKCNLACTFCKNGTQEVQSRGNISLNNYKFILIQGKGFWERVNLWGTGEPFLHPDFFEMASLAKRMNVERIKVSTNGHYFTNENIKLILECGITDIRIGIESVDPETYRTQRVKGSLSKIVTGVKELVKARNESKKKIKLTICSVISTFDPTEKKRIEEFTKNIGADEFEAMPNIWGDQFLVDDLPKPTSRCNQQLSTFNVLANGDVIPCCHTYMGEIILGNIYKNSILEIWNGEPAVTERRSFLENKFRFCSGCNFGIDLTI
ncbi:radical SAM/SPASM domain-containing protein [Flavobacterium sp. UBA6031]|uniref:radical SAM/SPASM domain-containing protein n=1 Tax=Flavobacterium sp. UBA6031 TaxID=1946551 RepID=UPI0025B8A49D|nr:radical SAM/SPASM domain-containing protein [Flavobacterium sp. UBA6031]